LSVALYAAPPPRAIFDRQLLPAGGRRGVSSGSVRERTRAGERVGFLPGQACSLWVKSSPAEPNPTARVRGLGEENRKERWRPAPRPVRELQSRESRFGHRSFAKMMGYQRCSREDRSRGHGPRTRCAATGTGVARASGPMAQATAAPWSQFADETSAQVPGARIGVGTRPRRGPADGTRVTAIPIPANARLAADAAGRGLT
jgi:hypothetical protein